MKKIAIIIARGGSKRIPGKNIKEFLGKPIIAYSIEAAVNSNLFDEVMVSTDSHDIAEVAKMYGAKVPFMRSDKNSDDFATTRDVVVEVLDQYDDNFQCFCCIYPTAVFLSGDKLIKSFQKFSSSQSDFCFPIVKYSYPIQRSLVYRNEIVKFKFPEFSEARSQDLDVVYHDAGQFYWGLSVSAKSYKNFMMGKATGYIISEKEAQDIDTYDDWSIAEMKYKVFKDESII